MGLKMAMKNLNPPNHDVAEYVKFQFFFVVPLGKFIDSILYVLIVLLLCPTGSHQMPRGNANGYMPPL
jgi:hypothetical protein